MSCVTDAAKRAGRSIEGRREVGRGLRIKVEISISLAELVGGDLDTLGDVIDAAEDIRRRGVGAVLASLGADGVILLDAAGALYAEAPVTRVVSTVGAGDALLAGYLSTGSTREHRLATALQWAAAAVQHEGTLFTPVDAPVDVSIHESVDRARRLHNHEPAPTIAGPRS